MEPELKYYTVKQVRNWLLHNNAADGLLEKMIARQRAWSIVNNPYVKDDDAILSVILMDGEVAAYTACFPERLETRGESLESSGERIWWLTTLSCKPEYLGQGFGLIVIGQLLELHEGETVLDLDGADETIEICKMLGMQHLYVPFYRFRNKVFARTWRGQLAAKLHQLQGKTAKARNSLMSNINHTPYTLRYLSFVDDETYRFIQEHSEDTLPRTQAMINWILQYPFMQLSPLRPRTKHDLEFSSTIEEYENLFVQVWQDEQLVGVYLLRNSSWNLSLKCVYYADEASRGIVYQSVAEHILRYNPKYFETFDLRLAAVLTEWRLFDTVDNLQKSYSFPAEWKHTDVAHLQAWNGDMFV